MDYLESDFKDLTVRGLSTSSEFYLYFSFSTVHRIKVTLLLEVCLAVLLWSTLQKDINIHP
jgi:hypothetical protein